MWWADYYFITNLLLNFLGKNFLNRLTFGKVMGGSWSRQIAWSALCAGDCPAERWRTRPRSDVAYGWQELLQQHPNYDDRLHWSSVLDRQVPNWYIKAKFHYAIWFEPASNQLRTSSEPTSVMEFGFYLLLSTRRPMLSLSISDWLNVDCVRSARTQAF